MKKVLMFFMLIVIVISFGEITVNNPLNNSEVSGIIAFNWSESQKIIENEVSYWEIYSNDDFVAKTYKPSYYWNPEDKTYPKVDGWYSISIKAFDKQGKNIDECGINIYIKHHRLVIRLLERNQTVGNSIRFKIYSINAYNGADFPIVDKAQIYLYSKDGSFSLSETNWSTVTSVYINPGHTESQIIYYRSLKSGYKKIKVQREFWGEDSATVYFSPLPLSKIKPSSEIYYTAGSERSNRVRLYFEDRYSNPVQLKNDERFYLYLTDKNGEVSTDGKVWTKNSIIAKKGSSYIDFYYKNSKSDYENSLLVITHPQCSNTVLNIYVRSKPQILKVLLNKNKVDLNEPVKGRVLVLDSQSRDSFFSTNTLVDIFSSSKKGEFSTTDGWYPSTRLKIKSFSIASRGFYYKDTEPGTQTISLLSKYKSEGFKLGVANDVSNLVCVNCSKSTIAGSPVKMIIKTVNKYGQNVAAPSNLKVILKAYRGNFYIDQKASKPVKEIVFPKGFLEIPVYYRNTVAGKDRVAIYEYPDRGWKNIYEDIKVLPDSPNDVKVSNIDNLTAGKYSSINFEVLDKFGNPIDTNKGCKILLSSNSTSVSFDNKEFALNSYNGSFKVKSDDIGSFKIKITFVCKDKTLSKYIELSSKGYLPELKEIQTVAGVKKKIFLNFKDSSGKDIKSLKPIGLTYESSSNKIKTSLSQSLYGYNLSLYATEAGEYTIRFKKNPYINNDLTLLKVRVYPSSLHSIKIAPNKVSKTFDESPIGFKVQLLDKFGNVFNKYQDYSINVKSDIGESFDPSDKKISKLHFKNGENEKTFFFKPSKFGTSDLILYDSKTKIYGKVKMSFNATPIISIQKKTTIVKSLPIKIYFVGKDEKVVSPISKIKVFLSSKSGEFYKDGKSIKELYISSDQKTVDASYKNTIPGTYTLSFIINGKKIEKTVEVKDVPILKTFKLTLRSTELVVGNNLNLTITAYDQHGKSIKVPENLSFNLKYPKDSKLFSNGKELSKSLIFPKGTSSMKVSFYSETSGNKEIELSNDKFGKITYKFNLSPQKTEKVVVKAKSESYEIYKSYPIKVLFEDKYGNISNPSTKISLSLISENNIKFYNSKGKEISFITTNDATSFYIIPTRKGSSTVTITPPDGSIKSATLKIMAKAYPYTLKVSSVPPFSEGEISKAVYIKLIDRNNETITATHDFVLTLRTNSKFGRFFNEKMQETNKIIIPKDGNLTYFYYKDKSLGDHTISITASPTLKPTTTVISTVKPVKSIEFRDIKKNFLSNEVYTLSIVTVNEDGIQWYVGDKATIEITSNSTSLELINDSNKSSNKIKVNIVPYSSKASFKLKALKEGIYTLKAFWVERKIYASIKIYVGGKK